MEHKYCTTIFKSKYSLATHQQTEKYCLIQQKKLKKYNCICKFCNKSFKNEYDLSFHIITCNIKKNQDDQLTIIENNLERISQLENDKHYSYQKLKNYEEKIAYLEKDKHYSYQKLKDYEEKIVYLEKDNNRLLKEFEPLYRKKVAQIFWKAYKKQQKII